MPEDRQLRRDRWNDILNTWALARKNTEDAALLLDQVRIRTEEVSPSLNSLGHLASSRARALRIVLEELQKDLESMIDFEVMRLQTSVGDETPS